MDFDADIIMFKNTAVITVTERNLSFIIHNREIADTLSIFSLHYKVSAEEWI